MKNEIVGQILKYGDVFRVVVIVVTAGAKVSRLPSLKESLENKFSRGSLRLGRWETSAPTGTTITTTMKTSPCFNI